MVRYEYDSKGNITKEERDLVSDVSSQHTKIEYEYIGERVFYTDKPEIDAEDIYETGNEPYDPQKAKYDKAVALMEEEKFDEAYKLFAELKNFKDSPVKRAEIVKTNHHLAQVGDIIIFGSYEQDNNKENGKEPIEWQVIDVKEDKIFVISKYILDSQPMHSGGNCSWSKTNLRKWLDTTFLKSAFNNEEQSKILTTEYDSGYDSSAKLKNKIYILDRDEIEEYKLLSVGMPTAYTISLYENSDSYMRENRQKRWWTRTPSNSSCNSYDAVNPNHDYSNAYFGSSFILNDIYGVRPVMWIDISKPE